VPCLQKGGTSLIGSLLEDFFPILILRLASAQGQCTYHGRNDNIAAPK
jgi:hypothetical protein